MNDDKLIPTVTISLEEYEEMKNELQVLRTQVQRKTIVKYSPPPVIGWAVMAMVVIFGVYALKTLFV